MQAVRESRRDGVANEREACRVQRGQVHEDPRAGGERHGARDVAPSKDVLAGTKWRHAVGGAAPAAAASHYAEAAFVVAADPDGTKMVRWKGLREVCLIGGLEGGHDRRMLWCAWGAALCAWCKRAGARSLRASGRGPAGDGRYHPRAQAFRCGHACRAAARGPLRAGTSWATGQEIAPVALQFLLPVRRAGTFVEARRQVRARGKAPGAEAALPLSSAPRRGRAAALCTTFHRNSY